MAIESVRDTPLRPPYTAIVVDEVQDLTCVGLMLLNAPVGDAPDGLFLVGDGHQSVYPGGFTLAEAGVSLHGRGAVLERNYRNAREVLTAALAIVSSDVFDDLESDPLPGSRQVEIDRAGEPSSRPSAEINTHNRSQCSRRCMLQWRAECGLATSLFYAPATAPPRRG